MRDYLSKAVSDLPPGEELGKGVTDYTHLLPDNLRNAGYELRVMDYTNDNNVRMVHMAASYHNKNNDKKYPAGVLIGHLEPSHLRVHVGEVEPQHREQGLGTAMYEAMFAHVKQKHGISRVKGSKHSSMVRSVHQKLAEKHGLNYEAGPNYDDYGEPEEWRRAPNGSYDDKFRPYSYTLKDELPAVSNTIPFNDPDSKLDAEVDAEMEGQPGISRNDALLRVSNRRRTQPGGWFGKSEPKPVIPGRYRPKYDRNLNGWMELEPFVPAAMEQAGYVESLQKHVDAAARMLGVDADLSLKKCRELMDESDSLSEVVLRAFNAYSPENEKSLSIFLNDSELFKNEIDLGPGLAAYKIAPVRMEATETADAVQRAVDSGYINRVKLSGKHSRGSMLAKDPQTKVVYLLKPGSGKNSPALGVNEDSSSQSEREVAFWHVAKLLGISDTFPKADLILVNGHQTACLELLPFSFANLGEKRRTDKSLPVRILEPYRSNTTLFKWSLIDYILGNPDRHSQNIMVDPENKIVRLIDHGSAFAGQSFSPSEDDNSFIPYYLRAWTDRKFTQMDPRTRLRYMPTLGGRAEQVFDEWVKQIDGDRIAAVLEDYNIDPKPALTRLAKIMAMPGPKWNVLNRLWAGAI